VKQVLPALFLYFDQCLHLQSYAMLQASRRSKWLTCTSRVMPPNENESSSIAYHGWTAVNYL